jgi:hypothetical protein
VPEKGVLSITSDRRLLHWRNQEHGARQLADDVPPGALCWTQTDPAGPVTRAVVGQLQQRSLWLLTIDVDEVACRTAAIECGDGGLLAVAGHNGFGFLIYQDRVDVFELEHGRRVHSHPLPRGVVWQRDRFFSGEDSWFALAFDGLAARLEMVFEGQRLDGVRGCAITMVDLADRGPVAVTASGDLFYSADGRSKHVAHGLVGEVCIVAVARDGRYVVIAQADDQRRMAMIDLGDGTAQRIHGGWEWSVQPEILHRVRSTTLRHSFRAVRAAPQGCLTLVGRKDACLIQFNLQRGKIAFGAWPLDDQTPAPPFQPIDSPLGVGYSLHEATWSDGSRVVLDSRGLLHFQSADRAVRELTLVLHQDGAMAGWCSDGRMFGLPYFVGDRGNATDLEIYEQVLKPFLARLP